MYKFFIKSIIDEKKDSYPFQLFFNKSNSFILTKKMLDSITKSRDFDGESISSVVAFVIEISPFRKVGDCDGMLLFTPKGGMMAIVVLPTLFYNMMVVENSY